MKTAVFTYVLIMLHLIVHELGHAAAAHIMKIDVLLVRAGGGEAVFRAGCFELGFWVTGGHTDVDKEALYGRSFGGKLFFFEAGSLADLILWAVMKLFFTGIYDAVSSAVFFVLLFSNNLPVFPGSDVSNLRALIRSESRTGKERL